MEEKKQNEEITVVSVNEVLGDLELLKAKIIANTIVLSPQTEGVKSE